MPRRYSGNVTILVTDHDSVVLPDRSRFPNGHYKCHLSWPGGKAFEQVGAPRVLRHSVDSPIAYDDAARAALTFYGDMTRNIPGDFNPDFGYAGAIVSRRK